MGLLPSARLLFGLAAGLSLWAGPVPDARRSILVILPDPPGRPISTQVLEGIQSTIHDAAGDTAISADYIVQNFRERPGFTATQLAWYRAKYQNVHFDAIVVFGPQALLTLLGVRQELWPDVPVVFCGVDPWVHASLGPRPALTGTVMVSNLPDTLKLIRQVLPGTRHLALIGGASPNDRLFNSHVPPLVREHLPGVDLIDLTALPLEELKARIARLPDGTAALIFSYLYDSLGRPMFVHDLMRTIEPVTNAPIFDTNDLGMGFGIVGGRLSHYRQIGVEAARLTLRVLNGESAASIPVGRRNPSSVQFDYRQLRRWGIPESRLPAGSEVLFRPDSVWTRYWWVILLVVAGLLIESMLVARLLYQRRRARETEAARREAEARAQAAREEISHLNRIASMGELAASLAHEINQPLSGILSNAQAAQRFLVQSPPDLEEVGAALADIREDDVRASEIIRKMHQMVKKQPPEARAIDLNAAVDEAVALLRREASLRGVALEFRPERPGSRAVADGVQLKQVVLNLVLNAMEALAEWPGERRVVLETRQGGRPGEVELVVADSGPGVAAGAEGRIFQPFFTTKREGLGMGLSISSSIVTSLGGRLVLEPAPAVAGVRGATFRVTLRRAERVA